MNYFIPTKDGMRRKVSFIKYYKIPIVMVFSFIFGCTITINLVPIDKTCRIEDTDREFNIMQNSKLKNPDLIVLILSAPNNFQTRNTIRQTWLKFIDTSPQNQHIKFKMKHYFAIGNLGLNPTEVKTLQTEQAQYTDILLLPIYDSYSNLTYKLAKSFEWLSDQFDYGLGFKYVLKTDDDTFIRLDKLASEMTNMELIYLKSELEQVKKLTEEASPFTTINVQVNSYTKQNNLQLYWGYFRGSANVKKSGKWREMDWITCDKYVPYAQGGAYVLSKKLVSYIAKNAENLRFFKSEDVSVGFWLSSVNNVLRVHDIRFDTEWMSRGCQNYYLAIHKVQAGHMQEMFNNVRHGKKMCSDVVSKRGSYMYNWTLLPSQCCHIK